MQNVHHDSISQLHVCLLDVHFDTRPEAPGEHSDLCMTKFHSCNYLTAASENHIACPSGPE